MREQRKTSTPRLIIQLLFFIVVPVAGILSLEAVRAVRQWPAGDDAR